MVQRKWAGLEPQVTAENVRMSTNRTDIWKDDILPAGLRFPAEICALNLV